MDVRLLILHKKANGMHKTDTMANKWTLLEKTHTHTFEEKKTNNSIQPKYPTYLLVFLQKKDTFDHNHLESPEKSWQSKPIINLIYNITKKQLIIHWKSYKKFVKKKKKQQNRY